MVAGFSQVQIDILQGSLQGSIPECESGFSKFQKELLQGKNSNEENFSAGFSKFQTELLEEQLEIEKNEVFTLTSTESCYKKIEDVTIYRDMNLTQTTGLSRQDFCKLLANFKYDYDGFYERNAGIIYDLSQKYQVNEIFICGVFALESFYGSDEKHIVTHNYGSIMTQDMKLKQYETDAEGIEANYILFATCYFDPEGKYYKGCTIDDVGDPYCTPTQDCPSWANLVFNCMGKFLEED